VMAPVERGLRLEAALAASLPGLLEPFLSRQRWFAGKARIIERAALEDVAWLPGAGEPRALALIGVHYADRAQERYTLPLALADDPGARSGIGRLDPAAGGAWVVDGTGDIATLHALLAGFARAQDLPARAGARLRYGDLGLASGPLFDPAALDPDAIRPMGAEQSNSSVRIGRSHVFKLFRRLAPGENPELEIGRFLTAGGRFRGSPALRGSLTYVDAAGAATTLGVLQDLVASRGDGWATTVAALRGILGAAGVPEPLVRDMLVLGGLTGEFHMALASDPHDPDFAPVPIEAADVARWREQYDTLLHRVLDTLDRRAAGLPEEVRADAEAVVRARALLARPPRLPEPGEAVGFDRIRVHGDFHLGQTLRTEDGYVLMDFEGEPARPLAERRARQCALKDVAGMARSFDYAIEAARAAVGAAAAAGAPPLREAFLEGYLAHTLERGAGFLPRDRQALDAWTDFFELDKALYEVEYELHNRPDWVGIPLRGVRRILDRARDR